MNKLVAVTMLLVSTITLADTQGKIRPDPATPCSGGTFKPHELCFATPTDGIARAEYLSETFFAIILKTSDRCSIAEAVRLDVQGLFAANKVFSMRFLCDDDVEENISYTNVNDKYGFLAVYAGLTKLEAEARLSEVKATGRFPGANIRRMQAKLVYP
jgi:hypothetical protein